GLNCCIGEVEHASVALLFFVVGVAGAEGYILCLHDALPIYRSTDRVVRRGGMVDRDSTRRAADRAGHRVRAGDGLAGGGLQSDTLREDMYAAMAADDGVGGRQHGLTV